MVCGLTVVGIGPGNPDYLIPLGRRTIENADVLIGGSRALREFAMEGQKTIAITGNLSELESGIRAIPEGSDVVVMVSGDPGYYSLLSWLKKTFPAWEIKVVPGLSSIQVAFSRLAEVWQDAQLLSFHGRIPADIELEYKPGRKLAFLTDAEHNPGYICSLLLEKGWPENTNAYALERISYDDEKKVEGTLRECAELEGFSHSVLVVIA